MKRPLILTGLLLAAGVAFGVTQRVQLMNFNSGEMSPLMKGRVDFPKYSSGAQTLQNMLVRSQGPVTRRPGTKFIAEVKDSNDTTRIIPFEYSTSDNYIIEMGDGYFRFYRNGAQVLDGNDVYDVNSPYDANDLFEIQYAQDAQYMRLVHPDYPPYKLTRNSASHIDWTLSEITFVKGPFLDENETKAYTVTPSGITGDINIVTTSALFDANHVGALWQITHFVDSNAIAGRFWTSWSNGDVNTSDAIGSGLAGTWEANSTSIDVFEDQTYTVTTGGDWWGTFKIQRSYDDESTWDTVKSFSYKGNGNIVYAGVEDQEDAVYRVRMEDQIVTSHMHDNGEGECDFTFSVDPFLRHGVVEITAVTDANTVDATVAVDLASTDATWRWAEGAWSDYRGWPRTIEHHDQRCVYGGTTSYPQGVWASIVASQDADFDNFDEGDGTNADKAWTYVLPGMNPIQWIKSREYLMIGTTSGVGRLGSPDSPITPIEAPVYRLQARNGAAYIDAVTAVDAILYVELGGQKVRETTYTYAEDRYVAPDMTILSDHIAKEGITDIAFQNRPDPILWCVRSDGQLLSFTYERKNEVLAWARHITGQDVNDLTSWDDFESVAVIPGTSAKANGDTRVDDEVWVVVNRTFDSNSVRYIEQFQPLDWGDDPNYCWFVDCGGEGATISEGNDVEGTPAVAATYKYTYISDQAGEIWGIPLNQDGSTMEMQGLDDAGVARDAGSGLVGLPMAGHPYAAGESILIAGTTNYNGTFTLDDSTGDDEIVITDTYVSETFDNTEAIVKKISGLGASAGRMVMTADGTLYYGTGWNAEYQNAVVRVDTDGTKVYDFLDFGGWAGSSYTTLGLALSDDETYLYVYLSSYNKALFKFTLSTGAKVWGPAAWGTGGYDIAVDETGNVYVNATGEVYQFASANGAGTQFETLDDLVFAIDVDNDLDIVVAGGGTYCLNSASDETKAALYNVGVRTYDNSDGDSLCVGTKYVSGSLYYTPTIGRGGLVTHDEYIYTINREAVGGSTISKLQWDGNDLTLIDTAAGPTYGVTLYFDLYDRLVVVNSTTTVAHSDRFYYYNTDLEYLGKVENVPTTVLSGWDLDRWQRGNEAILGALGTDEVPAVAGDANGLIIGDMTYTGDVNICFYADGIPIGTYSAEEANDIGLDDYSVVIAGLNYFSILETMPLHIPETLGRPTMITNVTIDFLESMGAHVGASYDYSADWLFSDDEFATAIAPFSGYKGPAPFIRGTTKEPSVYIWEWDPIPMTIRSIEINTEVTVE